MKHQRKSLRYVDAFPIFRPNCLCLVQLLLAVGSRCKKCSFYSPNQEKCKMWFSRLLGDILLSRVHILTLTICGLALDDQYYVSSLQCFFNTTRRLIPYGNCSIAQLGMQTLKQKMLKLKERGEEKGNWRSFDASDSVASCTGLNFIHLILLMKPTQPSLMLLITGWSHFACLNQFILAREFSW